MSEELCGHEFVIDAQDIMGGWPPVVIREIPAVTLVCSLPSEHSPRNVHSDGVNEWMTTEE